MSEIKLKLFAVELRLLLTLHDITEFYMKSTTKRALTLDAIYRKLQGVSKKAQHKDFNYFCFEIPLYDK